MFQLGALICPRCVGRMELFAAFTDADCIHQYLSGVGLPGAPPPMARPPPQHQFKLVDYLQLPSAQGVLLPHLGETPSRPLPCRSSILLSSPG